MSYLPVLPPTRWGLVPKVQAWKRLTSSQLYHGSSLRGIDQANRCCISFKDRFLNAPKFVFLLLLELELEYSIRANPQVCLKSWMASPMPSAWSFFFFWMIWYSHCKVADYDRETVESDASSHRSSLIYRSVCLLIIFFSFLNVPSDQKLKEYHIFAVFHESYWFSGLVKRRIVCVWSGYWGLVITLSSQVILRFQSLIYMVISSPSYKANEYWKYSFWWDF